MDVRWSPDGQRLAVASNDNFIDIYDHDGKGLKPKVTCKGHSSFVTHVDWSADGKFLQSTSGTPGAGRSRPIGYSPPLPLPFPAACHAPGSHIPAHGLGERGKADAGSHASGAYASR